MSAKILMHPFTGQPAARLVPGKEVEIYDNNLLQRYKVFGIATTKAFREEHNIHKRGPIDPTDDKAVFAKAFEQFAFKHGLQQAGYYWRDEKDVHVLPPGTRLADYVIEIHKKWMESQQKTDDED